MTVNDKFKLLDYDNLEVEVKRAGSEVELCSSMGQKLVTKMFCLHD